MAEGVRRIGPDEREAADPTPGMARERAIDVDGLWSGLVTTEPHMTSGWHHHGEHETSIYVVDGSMRMEFGADGTEVVEAKAGDFLHVPAHVVHREGNPGDAASHLVVTRSGRGPVTVNVEGPSGG
jgi:uncharacterized RmlC-like cupin family protein